MEFLSIGTLMSFTMVAASVIILRYQPASSCQFKLKQPETDVSTPGDPPADASDKQSMLKQSQVLCHANQSININWFLSLKLIRSDRETYFQCLQSHEDIGRLKVQWRELPVLKNMSPEFTTTAAVCIIAAFMLAFALLVLVGYDVSPVIMYGKKRYKKHF